MTDTVLRGRRVRLRHWREGDRDAFAAMNADPAVMRHFVGTWDRERSDASADRVAAHFERRGYGWWVLEVPGLSFAGCVGLFDVDFELAGLAGPQVEVAWRLVPAAWGQGYATEAAALCLGHARDALGLARALAFAVPSNLKSLAVMHRLGLQPIGRFEHPRVPEGHALREHLLYAAAWR